MDSNCIIASSISSDRTDYRTAGHILVKLDKLPWKYDIYCADSGYDSLESFQELEKREIEAYIKPQDWEISKTRSYRSDIGRSVNMAYVEKDDCFICGHVHDELIIECKPEVSLDELCRQMARVPDWMPGLKLDAAGYATPWYCRD